MSMCPAPACGYPVHVHGSPGSRRVWGPSGDPRSTGRGFPPAIWSCPGARAASYTLQPMEAPGPERKAVVLTESGSKSLPALGLVQKQT